jgi:hypothetical protein
MNFISMKFYREEEDRETREEGEGGRKGEREKEREREREGKKERERETNGCFEYHSLPPYNPVLNSSDKHLTDGAQIIANLGVQGSIQPTQEVPAHQREAGTATEGANPPHLSSFSSPSYSRFASLSFPLVTAVL